MKTVGDLRKAIEHMDDETLIWALLRGPGGLDRRTFQIADFDLRPGSPPELVLKSAVPE